MKWDAERWERPCEFCVGEKCGECAEKGWVNEQSAPSATITSDGRVLFQAYRVLKDYARLPAPGAWFEQTATFLLAVDFCDRVHTVFIERKANRDAETEKMKREIDRMMGSNG